MREFEEIEIVFDATSAPAHAHHHEALRGTGRRLIDLTPAAIGPYVVPVVNLEGHYDSTNLNMVSCGGQATIPMVAAVHRAARVQYAEIVASIASKSAGPGTRANIDEFTQTTARAIESVGGAAKGKAIIVLNPADPPLIMRNTIFCLSDDGDPSVINASILRMVEEVRAYVPGYRLKPNAARRKITDGVRAAQLLVTALEFSPAEVAAASSVSLTEAAKVHKRRTKVTESQATADVRMALVMVALFLRNIGLQICN